MPNKFEMSKNKPNEEGSPALTEKQKKLLVNAEIKKYQDFPSPDGDIVTVIDATVEDHKIHVSVCDCGNEHFHGKVDGTEISDKGQIQKLFHVLEVANADKPMGKFDPETDSVEVMRRSDDPETV